MNRNILIVTGSRGEYGYIKPIIREIENTSDIDYDIVATNMLLIPEFGNAINTFSEDKIKVKYKVDMSMSGYTNASMSKSLGIFIQSFTDIVRNENPSIILISGDRGEMLGAAIVGAHMNIPVAHVQAGEVSGNIDGMTRHAITKFAHLHFASNNDAQVRLQKMGEQKFRIYNTGAPQLDEINNFTYLSKESFYRKFHLKNDKDFAIILLHPITEESHKSESHMSMILDIINHLKIQAILIFPNNDAGSIGIQNAIEANKNSQIIVTRNLDRESYINLMKNAKFLIGNSSSGILEAASFKLPVINIGRRQNGRLQSKNVINVDFNKDKINHAIEKIYNNKVYINGLKKVQNLYGDGKSAKRIVNILKDIQIDKKLLIKDITY
tara:strand:- start:3092 stop:4237 length:1146 start_codon:yes stop_codon:yes gene_type:complete